MPKKILDETFIQQYVKKDTPFKNWGLGEFTYTRTYSRIKDDGTNEQWYETIERVIEGTFSLKKNWFLENGIYWDQVRETKYAEKMYDLMFNVKFLPGGRGLWSMGTKITESKHIYAALNNCAFVSTGDIETSLSEPFTFLMDACMLGVGVGFDTDGAGKIVIQSPNPNRIIKHKVDDSREGWVHALKLLLESYFLQNKETVDFDYSGIRVAGTQLSHFGGLSSGSEPLQHSIKRMREVLEKNNNSPITSRTIVDIMNLIGLCVVSGNVRRSAEISIGSYDDKEFINLKNYEKNPERGEFGWLSNNSIKAQLGMDYSEIAERIVSNGEPGVIWLDNMRKYSRMNHIVDNKDKNAQGCNPCSEQTLESHELCCVSGSTLIQTKNGVYQIETLVGKEVEIYNGEKWSKVTPFVAAQNKDLYRVWLSDGSYLDCTEDHAWHLKTKTVFRRTETKDIVIGAKSAPWSLQNIEGKSEPLAYEYGLFSGDGFMDRNKPMLCVCGDKIKLQELNIPGKWYKSQIKEGYSAPYNRLSFKNILDIERCIYLNDKTKGLPTWVFEMDDASIRNFVAGLIDTDGNVCKQVNTDNVRIFGNEEKIRDLQLLLRRIGINHATIYSAGDKGEETNKGIRNYSVYCCYIPSYECGNLPTRIKKVERIGSMLRKNNAYDNSVIDSSRKQKIVKVEKLEGKFTTYCFTEPEKHMGVFGNVLTYQCLVETFINRHETLDEFLHTLKFAFLYAKTVTLGMTQWDKTNEVIKRNRRIGTSLTGITNFMEKNGIDTLRNWCKRGYDFLKFYDKRISAAFNIPQSIKITSVKPSGTVSLLVPNTAPGIHFPESRFYIRRVRISVHSNLWKQMEERGYFVEPSVTEPSTKIINFPVDIGNVRAVKDVSMWEQLELLSLLQEVWADNQVSCTVTFNAESEGKFIKHALNYYQYKLKSVSFLPSCSGQYPQMPYEAITEEQYHQMVVDVERRRTTSDNMQITEDDHETEVFCTGDKCQFIPPQKRQKID